MRHDLLSSFSSLAAAVTCCLLSGVLHAGESEGLGGNSTKPLTDAESAEKEYAGDTWRLIWSDEFEEPGAPSPERWGYERGFVRNKELQYYTADRLENARVSDGCLIITAIREPWEKAGYTSASVITKGKFQFTYGKVEIRARIPTGRGLWPALWTLGTNMKEKGWPLCGEIDLMENVGFSPEKVHFTIHTGAFNHTRGTQIGRNITVPKVWEDFHRFGIVWTPKKIEWFFDGKLVHVFENDGQGETHWPFDAPQYLLMNLAVGGGWGGQKGVDDTVFPVEFRIDYVRVWQK